MNERVEFYRTSEVPYGCFSNFYRAEVKVWGKVYPTSEHAYQATKFLSTDPAQAEAIRKANWVGDAARMGRDRAHPARPDWDAVREDAMRCVLLAKFAAHPDLQAILLGSGDALIVEHSTKDSYWADGGDGSGQNRLGLLLMEVRDVLREGGERLKVYSVTAFLGTCKTEKP